MPAKGWHRGPQSRLHVRRDRTIRQELRGAHSAEIGRDQSSNCRFFTKSAQTIVADLGIVYSGNCYANLDLKSPPERLRATLQNLGAQVIITSASYSATLGAMDVLEETLMIVEDAMIDESIYNSAALCERRSRIIDTDPLCIIHTSGSTGVPRESR